MIRFVKPTVKDISAMQELVLEDVANGNILVRNESEMATTIRSYTVAYKDEVLVGFVALHIHTPLLAEIRSLVVSSDLRGQGIGQKLISHCINEAKQIDISELLVLTYQAKLFEKFDFKIIEKSTIPDTKIWADCIKCKHFPICDEVALTLKI
ncbi:MAG TPA: N-acetyltransferase [Arcobacter sp.]|nr:N-acetyltransferase [Arcobacter sp.]HIP56076.1 N-acetyltransferase [Arcobacter sp.]